MPRLWHAKKLARPLGSTKNTKPTGRTDPKSPRKEPPVPPKKAKFQRRPRWCNGLESSVVFLASLVCKDAFKWSNKTTARNSPAIGRPTATQRATFQHKSRYTNWNPLLQFGKPELSIGLPIRNFPKRSSTWSLCWSVLNSKKAVLKQRELLENPKRLYSLQMSTGFGRMMSKVRSNET